MSGFAALYREATEHPLFVGDSSRLGAWSWLILKACWKPTRFDINGKTVTLERGQICVSRSQLAEAWGWKPSAVERFLSRLETDEMIGRATGQGRTVITIRNYSKYQDVDEQTGQATGQPTERYGTRTGGRTKTGQATGQAQEELNYGNNDDIADDIEQTGQAIGQRSDSDRTAKEQRNKGTIEPDGSNNPPTPHRDRDWPGLPDWLPAIPWNAWLDMRKKKRKWPTPRAVELTIADLTKWREKGHDPGTVLDRSTLNHWIGIFEPKDDRNGNRSATDRRNPAGEPDRRTRFQQLADDDIGIPGG